MKRIILLTLAIIFFTSFTSFSQDNSKTRFALGWYSLSAPVGGRILINNTVGVDLGIGYADKNILGSDKDRFHLNLGVLLNAVQTQNVNFFIRPGLELQTNARTQEGETKSKMIITADLGAEWFVTDNLSLSVGHGLQFEQLSSNNDESKWGLSALRALSFSNVGFHFYFN